MTALYLPPCRCAADPHDATCPRFDSAHDPPGLWSPSSGPFSEGADDDPETPGRCRDAADSGYPPARDYGFPADEYDLRHAPDGRDF